MTKTDIDIFHSKKETSAGKRLAVRSEQDTAFMWNTAALFPDDESWEQEYKEVQPLLEGFDKYRGKLGNSAETLASCFRYSDETEMRIGKLAFYASRRFDEDTRIAKYQGFRDRINNLSVLYEEKTAFVLPEILSIPESKIREFIENNGELQTYRHYLDNLLRTRAHILSQSEEKILAQTGETALTPYKIFSMFNDADIKFPSIKSEKGEVVEVTKGRFSTLLKSRDRRVRKDAYDAFYGTYANWLNTLSASLAGQVKQNIFYARVRKYDSALNRALDSGNIPPAVYDNVIETVNENLSPLHRYFDLRQQLLNIEQVRPWDLYAPLIGDVEWKVSFEEAARIIREALKPLGEKYLEIIDQALTSGWIDVYENQGKRSGAYSSSTYSAPHPYILMNYNGELDDLFTLTHELGHSMHSYLTNREQPFVYSHYTIFVAEVASTLNESLLMDYLLKTTEEKQKKRYLLNHYLDQIRGTFYTQALFAEFEKTIHREAEAGTPLTAEFFNNLAKDIYLRYFGPSFKIDNRYETNWCRIPHFYYNFYVYQYATGYSAATAISGKILSGDVAARDAYLNFLGRGSSDYSIDLLKGAGVDMSSKVPVQQTAKLFARLVDEMERL